VSETYSSANFHVGADASGDILVAYAAATAAAGSEAVIGSPADILGGYATEIVELSSRRASDTSAFDS
jgi:hypothetical protein